MKTLMIFLFAITFFLQSSVLFCDEKDSVEKYRGTTYYGDIHKIYDSLPKPIINRTVITLINNYLPANNIITLHEQYVSQQYEIGLILYHKEASWHLNGIKWFRYNHGLYYKRTIGKRALNTIGISNEILSESFPLTFIENIGLIFGDKSGIEFDIGLGYDIFFNNWKITPKALYNINVCFENIKYEYEHILKPNIYFGFDIGFEL